MGKTRCHRSGAIWLELLFVLGLLLLLIEMFPFLWGSVLQTLDMRNWSRPVWMMLNIGIVFFLVGVRFGLLVYEQLRERNDRLVEQREKHDKKRKSKEERKLFERLHEARKRQVI